ncbi:methyltransferase-A70 family protein [Flindersiella endophytica]
MTDKHAHQARTDQLAGKRYRTLLADPPWDINQRGNKGAIRHYPLMSLDEIKALPVRSVMADDSHAWVWVTNGTIDAGREVLEAWGYQYRSILTWIKPRLGLGPYLRNQTEHVLLGTRGSAPIQFRGQGTWLYAPQQEHSTKPQEQYAVIERCSPGPYLELFARAKRAGWNSWGMEVDSDVEL